jgi:hypothetical protein
MEPQDRQLLVETHGFVKGMEPVLAAAVKTLEVLERRQRGTEDKSIEHEIKIGRIQSDIEETKKSIRHIRSDKRVAAERSILPTWLEFLTVAPTYVHWVIAGLSLATMTLGSALLTLWRHRP